MSRASKPAEGDIAYWIRSWGPREEAAAEPWLEAFGQLLHGESAAVIGSPNHPIVEGFVAQHRRLLKRAESDCVEQAMMVEGPLRQVLFKYYQSMGARESAVTRMSRMLPLCIGELLNDLDEPLLIDILRANVWGYEALRIQDDFLDEPGRVQPEWILLCGLFYRWCTEVYCRYTTDVPRFFADYQLYHTAMSNAILAERQQPWAYSPCTRVDLLRAGQRAGLIKLCGSTLFSLRGKRDLVPDFDRCIDLHLASRQLLDDLQDFRSDAEERRLTAPISMVWSALAKAGVQTLSPQMLYRGLAMLDVAPRSLELVREFTVEAMACLNQFPDAMLHKLLALRAEQVEKSLAKIISFQEQMRAAIRA